MDKKTDPQIVLDLTKQFGNDQDLGKEYRKFILSYKGSLDEFCKKYPNDFELGTFLRKKVRK